MEGRETPYSIQMQIAEVSYFWIVFKWKKNIFFKNLGLMFSLVRWHFGVYTVLDKKKNWAIFITASNLNETSLA